MSASEPTLPGAYPATPGEGSNGPDPFIEAAKVYALDLSEKTRPYLPDAVAKHLPEKSQHGTRSKTNIGEVQVIQTPDAEEAHNGNVKQSYQREEEPEEPPFSNAMDDKGQQLEGTERTVGTSEAQVVASATIEGNDDDGDNVQSHEVVIIDPDAQGQPKDDVVFEQKRQELFKEEITPPIFISNHHLSGNEGHYCPAAHGDVEQGISMPSPEGLHVSEGVAEDQLLADYLGPYEPTVSTQNEGNTKETSAPTDSTVPAAQFEPRVRDFALEEEIRRMSLDSREGKPSTSATVVIDSINEPYKSHRLENIQEKTRDNRLPPLPPSPDALASSPDASCRTGTGNVLAKLRHRRKSSAGSKQDTDEEISEGRADKPEQANREDFKDFPQPQKVGLMTKIKGEIKVAIGALHRNKEKEDDGKREKH